jgi:hypothetical protein
MELDDVERQSRAYVSFTLLPLDQLHAVRVIANCIVLILTLTHQPARTRNQIGASKSVQLLNTLQKKIDSQSNVQLGTWTPKS